MFSQLKHHDHGDRSRSQIWLTRSLPGLLIMRAASSELPRTGPGNGLGWP